MTNVFVIMPAVILVANCVTLAVLSRRVRPTRAPAGSGPAYPRISSYAPMLRMLDSGDLRYLRAQPGFTPAMERRLRRQRASMFSYYLRSLENDFGMACDTLRAVMTQSQTDRRDLASVLMRNQLRFAVQVRTIRFQVWLYRWGIGKVDVRGVFETFGNLRETLGGLEPVLPGGAG